MGKLWFIVVSIEKKRRRRAFHRLAPRKHPSHRQEVQTMVEKHPSQAITNGFVVQSSPKLTRVATGRVEKRSVEDEEARMTHIKT